MHMDCTWVAHGLHMGCKDGLHKGCMHAAATAAATGSHALFFAALVLLCKDAYILVNSA